MPEFKRTSSDEVAKKIIIARSWAQSARTPILPSELKYTVAYDACRMWCEIVLRAENVRVRSTHGHHAQTIDMVTDFLGDDFEAMRNRLQQARKTRNSVLYEGEIEYVTASIVEDLLVTLNELEAMVMSWLKEKHSDLLPLL